MSASPVLSEVSAISAATSGGLASLSKLSGLLAILSADDIDPAALIQLERLGTMFHLNGELARKTPNYLRRCQSNRLGRLSVFVGFRAGDAASMLADSAGGQAIAVLLMLLQNLYGYETTKSICGELLYTISREMLPMESVIASPSQLHQVMRIVSSKMAIVGFGNLLAREVTRIRQVYLQLDKMNPPGLLDELSMDAMVESLKLISIALREEDVQVRFTGTRGGANLVGLVMALCPEDALIIVEGNTIHQGVRTNIIFDIHGDSLLAAVKEHVLLGPDTRTWLNITKPSFAMNKISLDFKWHGWLTTRLNLFFFNRGYKCSVELIQACCGVVLHYTEFVKATQNLHGRELALLGTSEWMGTRDALHQMFGVEPPADYESPLQAVIRLSIIVAVLLKCPQRCSERFTFCNISCHVPQAVDEESPGLNPGTVPPVTNIQQPTCSHDDIWNILHDTLWTAISCLYIRTTPETIVPAILLKVSNTKVFTKQTETFDGVAVDALTGARANRKVEHIRTSTRTIMSPGSPLIDVIFGSRMYDNHAYDDQHTILGFGDSSSVLFPDILYSMTPSESYRMSYVLVEGNFILNQRYYHTLECRTPVSFPVHALTSNIPLFPSAISRHSDLRLTASEGATAIVLDCEIGDRNSYIHRSLGVMLHSFFSLQRTEHCDHDRSAPLTDSMGYTPCVISVVNYGHLDHFSKWRRDQFLSWQEEVDSDMDSEVGSEAGSYDNNITSMSTELRDDTIPAEHPPEIDTQDQHCPSPDTQADGLESCQIPDSHHIESSLPNLNIRRRPDGLMRTNLDIGGPEPLPRGGQSRVIERSVTYIGKKIQPRPTSTAGEQHMDIAQDSEGQSVPISDSILPSTRNPRDSGESRQAKIIEIAMIRGNRQAQLLSASPQAILMVDCCLQCAWHDAIKLRMRRIIVA